MFDKVRGALASIFGKREKADTGIAEVVRGGRSESRRVGRVVGMSQRARKYGIENATGQWQSPWDIRLIQLVRAIHASRKRRTT